MPRLQRIASLGIAALTLITCHTVSALTLADIGQPARPPREVVYRTVAGRGLRLFVSLPDSARPAGGWPVLLCIHGGGWGSGTPEYMAHIATYFASRGMLAVNVEYRISDPKQTPRMPIQECLADCRAALRYVREHAADLEADPARIAVTGDSAGGHLAAALGTLPAEGETRPAAMILFNPVLDLVTLPWRDGIPGVATPMPGESGDGLTPEERGRLISPLHFAGEKGTPPDHPHSFRITSSLLHDGGRDRQRSSWDPWQCVRSCVWVAHERADCDGGACHGSNRSRQGV